MVLQTVSEPIRISKTAQQINMSTECDKPVVKEL